LLHWLHYLGHGDEPKRSQNGGQLLFGDWFLNEEIDAFPFAFVLELGLLVRGVHHKCGWSGLSFAPVELSHLLDHFQTVKERHVEVKDE